jgi:hypothetical protein
MAKQYKSTDIANTAKSFIHNKFVLYFVFAVALLNLFFSAVKRDYLFCAIFILTGFVVAFFNKNMTVILVCTVAIANIVSALIGGRNPQMEGMAGDMEGEEEEDNEEPFSLSPEKKVDLESESKAPAASSKETGMGSALEPKDSNANKKQIVHKLKNEAQDLLEVQERILKGFEKIEPEMTRAEKLINQINGTAQQIQAFQGMGAN